MSCRLASMITIALCLLACAESDQEAQSNRSDVQAIAQLFIEFSAAFNEADLESLRSMYADDALLMPPGEASLTGPDAIIEQMWAPMFETFEVEADLPIREIESWGDWGFVRGTYQMQLDPHAGGDPMRDEGQFIDVVRKDSTGDWKIARAIWNSTGI